MDLIPIEVELCSIIDHKQAPNWYSTFGYQWHASIELEEWGTRDKRQGVEALILTEVIDNETWIVSRLDRGDFNCSASLSGERLVGYSDLASHKACQP
jgi:hypothetical protein